MNMLRPSAVRTLCFTHWNPFSGVIPSQFCTIHPFGQEYGDNFAKAARSLGRFKRVSDALKFVEALYKAGATEVIAPDIYAGKAGDQFADCLLVKLPGIAAKRKAIRKVCAQLSKRKLGAFQPDKDIGESHLYLLLA